MISARALALAVLLAPAAAGAASRGGPLRTRAEASPGFRLGAVTATHSASSSTLTAAGIGGYVMFDIPGLLVDVSGDAYAGQDRARLFAAGLGGYYPFVDAETTPYLGGGLKLGWSQFGGDGAFGLHPFAALGLLVGRSYSPQIRIELGWFMNTASERARPGEPSHHASGPTFSFGIGF